MTDTQGLVILIGGAGGIGRAAARRLLDRGATVLLAGRSEARLAEAQRDLPGVETAVCDATDFAAVEQLVTAAVERHGSLAGIANLAGSILIKPAHMTSFEEFQATIDQNLRTAFAVVRAGLRAMQRSGGSIVLMSSCAALTGLPSHEAIAAAKAGVIGLARSAAATGAPARIRVNCIAPGLVDTPMAERLTKSDAARKASESLHPLGRLGTPADIAPTLAWLLSPESAWVTGQCIGIDGGLAAIKGKA